MQIEKFYFPFLYKIYFTFYILYKDSARSPYFSGLGPGLPAAAGP